MPCGISASPYFSAPSRVVTVKKGDTAVLQCDVNGDKPISVAWTRGGKLELTPASNYRWQIICIVISCTLTILCLNNLDALSKLDLDQISVNFNRVLAVAFFLGWGETGSTQYVIPVPDGRWVWGSHWNEIWQGKFQYQFAHHKFHTTWPALKPWLPKLEAWAVACCMLPWLRSTGSK
jgi:hypothetical protein